ncbi:MAG: hypothetical protein AAFX06_05225 [Planctomycetota bacterium]
MASHWLVKDDTLQAKKFAERLLADCAMADPPEFLSDRALAVGEDATNRRLAPCRPQSLLAGSIELHQLANDPLADRVMDRLVLLSDRALAVGADATNRRLAPCCPQSLYAGSTKLGELANEPPSPAAPY